MTYCTTVGLSVHQNKMAVWLDLMLQIREDVDHFWDWIYLISSIPSDFPGVRLEKAACRSCTLPMLLPRLDRGVLGTVSTLVLQQHVSNKYIVLGSV